MSRKPIFLTCETRWMVVPFIATGKTGGLDLGKVMASGPITSWQIDGETVETVSDFLFLGSKITAFERGVGKDS